MRIIISLVEHEIGIPIVYSYKRLWDPQTGQCIETTLFLVGWRLFSYMVYVADVPAPPCPPPPAPPPPPSPFIRGRLGSQKGSILALFT